MYKILKAFCVGGISFLVVVVGFFGLKTLFGMEFSGKTWRDDELSHGGHGGGHHGHGGHHHHGHHGSHHHGHHGGHHHHGHHDHQEEHRHDHHGEHYHDHKVWAHGHHHNNRHWHDWYWHGGGNWSGTRPGYYYDPNFYYNYEGTPSVNYEWGAGEVPPTSTNTESQTTIYQIVPPGSSSNQPSPRSPSSNLRTVPGSSNQ